jgi:uncharacterized protein (TIGR03118 family)
MFSTIGRTALNHKRRPFAPLTLEQLEDRCVLSAAYLQTNLVSDLPGVANTTDPNLVNPWGIVASSSSAFWIADNGTGLSTLYNGSGTPQSLVVTIPPPAGGTSTAAPTGIVFNSTTDFSVSSGGKTGTAAFIFATEDGTISGWSPKVNATNAILEVDNSAVGPGAVYKGLALGNNTANGNLLFATNFRAGTVDVFDKNFKSVNLGATAFTDTTLPAGFAPFGIRNIGGKLYVTYAMQNDVKHDDVAGPGNGFIDVYDTNGNLVQHFASGGTLNSPWGLAVAPSNFGTLSNDLLVGNFGDGLINAFNATTGDFIGQLQGTNGNTVHIDGLWGLNFGNGASAGPTNTLFFTAGINGERNGLFGSLQPSVTGSDNDRFVDQVFQDLLNRQADDAGLTFWTGQLDQGVTRSQVVAGIEKSTEYLTDVVQKAYQQFLHRPGDSNGVSFWVNFIQQGGTVEGMEAGIASSSEYFQVRGGGTNSGFLTALYQDALGRAIDTNGQNFFTQQLNGGATLNQVASQVLASMEFQQNLVKSDFQLLLHRTPDNAGLTFYGNALQQGQTDQQIAASIGGSDEFFGKL